MKRTKTILLFCSGLILSGIMMEASLQLIERTPLWYSLPIVPPILGRPDSEIGYALTPHARGIWVKENRASVKINSLGLRDREMTLQKPKDTFRIALTGDSQTEALQVQYHHTFKHLIEKSIKKISPHTEIVNLAASGNGPLNQFLSLKKYENLNFDYIISIIPFGDFLTKALFHDDVVPAYITDETGAIKIGYRFRNRNSVKLSETSTGQFAFWFLQNSALMRLFYWQFREAPVTKPPSPSPPKDSCKDHLTQRHIELWREKKPKENWLRVEKFFQDFSSFLKSQKLKATIVVSIPVPPIHCKHAKTQRLMLFNTIKSTIKDRNIMFYDLQSALLNKMNSKENVRKLYGFGQRLGFGHLNHEGHRVVATLLSAHVREKIMPQITIEHYHNN